MRFQTDSGIGRCYLVHSGVPKVLDQLKPVPSQPINTFGTPLSLLGPLRETCSSWHGMFLPVAGKRKTTPRGVD